MNTWLRDVEDLDGSLEVFTLLKCSSCGLVQTDPYPSESTIASLYRGGVSSDYEFPEASAVGRVKEFVSRRQVRRLRQSIRFPKTVLDFGTGAGRYAAAAATVFPSARVYGTDFNVHPPAGSYYEHAINRLTYLSYAQLPDSGMQFDLIVARHVLEHMHHPVAMLEAWLKLLAPSGVLYIEVPNAGSRTGKLVGGRWPLWYVPKHLSHFDQGTLRRAIEQAGGRSEIGRTEMPMMGNVLALLSGKSRSDKRFQIPGAVLFPLQKALETGRGAGSCLYAFVRNI